MKGLRPYNPVVGTITITAISNGILVEVPESNYQQSPINEVFDAIKQFKKEEMEDELITRLQKEAAQEDSENTLNPDQRLFTFPNLPEALAFIATRFESKV